MAENHLLEVKHLKTYFKVKGTKVGELSAQLKAVDDVSFVLEEGECFGIVGESGCGKSTLGNTIVRLLDPTDGEIIFKGENIASLNRRQMKKHRADIQMIFQDPYSSLNPRMRVFDIIAEPLITHKIASGKELEEKVYDLMKNVGLDKSYANRFPHEFSGGQRQRIGIARALALNPKLIICDEPVSALDVSIQAQILNLLRELQRKFKLTYIFIAHGLPTVKYISDRIAVMYLGRIVEYADKDALFAHPCHPYTEGLLDAIPVPDPDMRKPDKEHVQMTGDIPSALNPPSGCYFHPRCPYADENCAFKAPELRELEPGHFVACHYPLPKKGE